MTPPTLRVGFVPGVEPDRFARRWRETHRPARLELVPVSLSHQQTALESGDVDMCFLRLPVRGQELHTVALWQERPVIVVGTDHVLSVLDEISEVDLAQETEIREQHLDDARDRVELAATGAGYARMPMSLARLHHRKDVVHRLAADGEPTSIALAWPHAADDELRQQFVGVVRGRTPRSSR